MESLLGEQIESGSFDPQLVLIDSVSRDLGDKQNRALQKIASHAAIWRV